MRGQVAKKKRTEIRKADSAPLPRLKDIACDVAAIAEWLKRFQALSTKEKNRALKDNPELLDFAHGGRIAQGDLLIGPLAGEYNGDRDEGEYLFLTVLRPMRERLIAEYDLKTGAELMLVDAVVLSYYQYIRAAGALHGYTAYGKSYDYEMLVRYAQTYLARANELFLRNLEALRQMKAAPFTLKIAQAGQVNVGEKQVNVSGTPTPEVAEAAARVEGTEPGPERGAAALPEACT